MDDSGGNSAMQKVTLVGQCLATNSRSQSTPQADKKSYTALGQQGKHGALPQQAALLREPRAAALG